MKLTEADKNEITRISQEFAQPLYTVTGGINGSGWLIVDPLSAYLNTCGYENKVYEIPANETHCQVLVMEFKDGSQFIPAGADLHKVSPLACNWQWM